MKWLTQVTLTELSDSKAEGALLSQIGGNEWLLKAIYIHFFVVVGLLVLLKLSPKFSLKHFESHRYCDVYYE